MENEKMNCFECPTCHKKYQTITEMANCILNDEKEKTENERQKELEQTEKAIYDTYKNLKTYINKYNRLSGKKNFVPSLITKTDLKPAEDKKCECSKSENKNCSCSKSNEIDEETIKKVTDLCKKLLSPDLFIW